MSTVATLALLIMYTLPDTHFLLVFILRIISGLGHGALFPATYTIWLLWAVPHERGTLTALSFSGTHMGTCKSMSLYAIVKIDDHTLVFCSYYDAPRWYSLSLYNFRLDAHIPFVR
jgi:MFS family permease